MSANLNQARPVKAGRLFYMPVLNGANVGAGLTNVAAERIPSATTPVEEDLRVLGGTTDLNTSLVSLSDGAGNLLTADDTPLKQIFGRRTLARPFYHWPTPLPLRRGNRIRVSTLNVGPENGGNFVFLAEPVDAKLTQFDASQGQPYWMPLALNLAGNANERKVVSTLEDERPVVVWGGASDLRAVSVRITDAERNAWMYDFTPIWAVFGDNTGQIITEFWRRPYIIPSFGALQIEVLNPAAGAEASGNIYLFCSRLSNF